MLRFKSVLRRLDLWFNDSMTEKGCESLGCAMQHNRVLESLLLPYSARGCLWSQCAEFFTGCNRVRLWSMIQDENAVIPWHNTFHVLLNGSFGVEYPFSHRLSAVFVLLRSRPDIVVGGRRLAKDHPSV